MNIKDKLPGSRICRWMVFGGCALILLWAHTFCTKFGDDLVYEGIWGREPLFQFLQGRYADWSSRIWIEAAMMPLTAANPWVWRILDVVMILLLLRSAAWLFGMGKEIAAQLLLFCMIWTIPFFSLSSAGWITTTVNYLWPMTVGLVAMYPLKCEGLIRMFLRFRFCGIVCCVLYRFSFPQSDL